MSVHAGVVILGGLLLGIAGLQLQSSVLLGGLGQSSVLLGGLGQSSVLLGGLGHVPLIARVCTAEL